MRGIQYYLTVSGSSASHSVDADRFVHQIGEAPNSFSGSRKEVPRPRYIDLRLRPYFQRAGYPQSTALSSGTVLQNFSQLFYYENLPEGFLQPKKPVQAKPEPTSPPEPQSHHPFVPLGFFDDFDEPAGSHPEPSRAPDAPDGCHPMLRESSKPDLPQSRWDALKSSSIDEPSDPPRFPEEFLGHPQLSDPPYAPVLEPEHPSKKEKGGIYLYAIPNPTQQLHPDDRIARAAKLENPAGSQVSCHFSRQVPSPCREELLAPVLSSSS